MGYCLAFGRISSRVACAKGSLWQTMDAIETGSLPASVQQVELAEVDVCLQEQNDPCYQLKLHVAGTKCTGQNIYERMEKDAACTSFFSIFFALRSWSGDCCYG